MLPPVPASILVLFSEFCNCAQPRFSMTCCFGFRKRRGCKPQRREIRLFKQRHPQAAQIASKMLWSVLAASKRTDFLSSLNPAIIPQVPTMAMWNETHTVPAVAQHCQSSGSHCRLPWTNIKPSVCLDFFASHYIKFHSREDLASWKRCAWVDLAITFRWFLFLKKCSCPCFIFAGPLRALPSFNLLTPHLKGGQHLTSMKFSVLEIAIPDYWYVVCGHLWFLLTGSQSAAIRQACPSCSPGWQVHTFAPWKLRRSYVPHSKAPTRLNQAVPRHKFADAREMSGSQPTW